MEDELERESRLNDSAGIDGYALIGDLHTAAFREIKASGGC